MSWLLLLAADGHGDVHTLLDPHGAGLVFWTAITFSIVLVVLYKFAWGPLAEALDQREANIAGKVADAEKVHADAEALRKKYEDQLEGIRQEAQQIIDEGEADKKRIIQEAHDKATSEAKAVRDRAEREIHLAKNKALEEVKLDAINLGVQIAEKVIAAEVDGAKHKAIVDEVLASYEQGA
jgi:F-type H+-transporting ATPase subunit b